jgi:hypothetical protein
VKRNFDVYLVFDDSNEARAQLDDLESREWDVSDEPLSNGLRRITKGHSNEDALERDLEQTLGPGLQVHYLTMSDGIRDNVFGLLQHLSSDHPDARKASVIDATEEPAASDPHASDPGHQGTSSADATNGSKAQPTGAAAESNDAVAQVIHQGALLLNSPPHLWDYIGAGRDRRDLALRVGTDLFSERASYARAVAWSISPESELLRRAAANDPLAKRMLEVRAGLTEPDNELRRQNVESRKQEIELQRVLIATLGDLRAQVRKWTWLAGWAPGFLIATLLFAMAMTAWLIDVAAAKLDGWALAPAIFALALFAISPIVLLLRERPLEGIDKWMPSGGGGGADTSSAGSDESAPDSSDAVSETTTSQTTTSRAGPRIGGHRGERPN